MELIQALSMVLNRTKSYILTAILLVFASASIAQEKPVLVVSKGHHQPINSIDISPDGKTIISGAADNLVKVYDLFMKQELNTFTEHTREVDKVLFSPDGKYIVSTSSHQLLIHAHPEGNLLHEIPIKNIVGRYSIYVSSNNKIYIGEGQVAKAYDIVTGTLERSIKIQSKNFVVLPDEKSFVSGAINDNGKKSIGFYSLQTGSLLEQVEVDNLLLDDYKISANGKKIAFSLSPGKVGVLDVKSKSVERIFESGIGVQYFIGLNKNGSHLITSGYDNHVRYWNVKTGELDRDITDLSPSGDPSSMSLGIRSMAISDDDNFIAFCYSDIIEGKQNYTVEWFNYKDLKPIGKHAGDVKVSLSIGIDHSGTILSTGTISSAIGVKCLDLTKGSQKAFIPGTAYLGTGGEYLAAVNQSDQRHPKLDIYEMPYVSLKRSFDLYGFANVNMSQSGKFVSAMDQKYIGNDDPTQPQVEPYIRVWNVETGEAVLNIKKTLYDSPRHATFSLDDKYIYFMYPEKIEAYSLITGEQISTNNSKVNLDFNNPITPDGKYIVSPFKSKLEGVSVENGEVIELLKLDDLTFPLAAKFSPDHKYIGVSVLKAMEPKPYMIQVFNWETKELVCELVGHNDIVRQLTFDTQNKHVYSVDDNGVILMWDLVECKAKATFLAFGAEDYMIQAPDGYYKASKGNIENIGFRQNGSLYTFDQFDLRYNRPDKVLEALGMSSKQQIDMYHRAYRKRLSRMGFDINASTDNLHAPILEILELESLPLKTADDEISVRIKATDESIILDRLNVVVNGVPIYGRLGKKLKDKNLLDYEDELRIPLTSGINQIQISTMNIDGTESLRKTFSVNCEKKTTKPDLYIVAIGVQSYLDSSMNLTYADKDAKDFAQLFNNDGNLYANVHSSILTNQEATKEQIFELNEQLKNTKVDDQIILYYSGHGLLDENLDYYLSTYDVEFTNPSPRGLSFDKFKGMIDGVPARNRLILVDACHSGEVDKEDIAFVPQDEEGDEKLTTKAFAPKGLKMVGLVNSFELMKDLFVELRKESGATIIASSSGKEFSLESDEWQNGAFTYALKEGLSAQKADENNDKNISVSELKQFLFIRVKELTNGEQVPTVRRENLQQDCIIFQK